MAAAREALAPVVVEAPERKTITCRFVLDGEGDRFVSGVEGVWIIGMGDADADAEFGFRFRVEFGLNKFGLKFGFGVLLLLLLLLFMAFAFEVEVDDDCCSFLDTCERVGVDFRCVTKRWTI
jgi:hypothetical protein